MSDTRVYDVIVIGAGAAGLFAAIHAAQHGRRVLLLEKNRKPGVKILMSGGTRCNLTHATDRRGIVEAFGQQGRFLHSALAALGPEEVVEMFESAGVATKVEATGKVFPASDRALDVQRACLRMLHKSEAKLRLDSPVVAISREDETYCVVARSEAFRAPVVILTTGGQSYPGCGTTGDGYAWAKALGHKIVPPRPALAPLTSNVGWVRRLQGVTLTDVTLRAVSPGQKPGAVRRGSLLFTHFGLSGPVAMNASRDITERPNAAWVVEVDIVPTVSEEDLLNQLGEGRQTVSGVLGEWLPKSLATELCKLTGVDQIKRTAELAKPLRRALVTSIKRLAIPITGTLGFKKAEVTAGGVALEGVDSRTMQSKHSAGLYLAGEVLDLDGPIGGYNFQAAFSTGWLAGGNV